MNELSFGMLSSAKLVLFKFHSKIVQNLSRLNFFLQKFTFTYPLKSPVNEDIKKSLSRNFLFLRTLNQSISDFSFLFFSLKIENEFKFVTEWNWIWISKKNSSNDTFFALQNLKSNRSGEKAPRENREIVKFVV